MVIWMAKMLVFFVENILKDEYLVQVNLDVLIILKLIYKTFYYRLMYIGLERVLKVVKNIEIFISRVKILEYYCELYILLKSIRMIFYIFLAPVTRLFIKIYIDIIEYKLLSINRYKYIVYLLDCYSNYQWIFFTKIKKTIFEKFVEVVIFLENQTSLKVQVIYLDNSIEFYPIKLATFVLGKGIYLKLIILRASS